MIHSNPIFRHRMLVTFLLERQALDKFHSNLNNEDIINMSTACSTINVKAVIFNSFFWSQTPEGDAYWDSLHQEFSSFYIDSN